MDAVQIVAIDAAYPELELAKQIAAYRERLRAIGPGIREPAHFRVDPGQLGQAGVKPQ